MVILTEKVSEKHENDEMASIKQNNFIICSFKKFFKVAFY